MSTSNKIILSVASLCLVAVVAIAAVAAVYSATNQTVSNQISVSYTVTDIAGSVSASYKIGDTGESGDMGTVTFKPEDKEGQGQALKEGVVSLTAQNDYVLFDYHFTNTLDKSTNLSYTATLVYTDEGTDDKNIELYYSFGGDVIDGAVDFETVTKSDNTSGEIGTQLVVAPGGEKHAYVIVKVESNLSHAKFNGIFKWTITAYQQV